MASGLSRGAGVTALPGTDVVDVSVVVVTYNAAEWTGRCLDALLGPGRPARSLQVVVVDNNSDEPTREQLRRRAGSIDLVQLEENIGFGRACNLGVARSTGRWVLLLNPDAVVRPRAVDALVDHLEERPSRGLVGGRTLRPDGSVDPSSCWAAPTLWSWFCFAIGLSSVFRRSPLFDPESMGNWQRDSVREVDIVTGCLLLSRRATWDELGGFDPDFFMYGEDADLSRRARLAGFRPSITPAAVAVHAVGASSSSRVSKQRLLLTGKATLARRQWNGRRQALGLGLLQGGIGLRAAGEAIRRRPDRTWRTLWSERDSWSQGWPATERVTTAG